MSSEKSILLEFLVSIVSIGFFLNTAKAETPPRCDLRTLTKNCDFFNERKDQKEIVLPDGGRFPNPGYKPPELQGPPAPPTPAPSQAESARQQQENYQKTLELQAQALDMLGDSYSSQFQLAFSSPVFLSMLKSSMENPQLANQARMQIPWPANARPPQQKVQQVSFSEFKSGFLDKLSTSDKAKLNQLLQELPKTYGSLGIGSGGGYSSQPALEAPKSEPRMTAADDRRLRDLVEQTRSLMLSEIDKGRSYNQLSLGEKAAYDKVKSVRFIPPTEVESSSAFGCASQPNAFYYPINHAFLICPSMGNFPKSNLVGVIAHELGHSIDPCHCQMGNHKIDKSKVIQQLISLDSDRDKSDVANRLKNLTNIGKFPLHDSDPIFGEAKRLGFIEETVAAGIERKDYAYDVTLRCLQRKIGFRVPTPEMNTYEVAQLSRIKAAQNNKLPSELSEAEKKSLVENLDSPDCQRSKILGYSESLEVMSDVWRGKVLGRYLELNPPKNDIEKVAAFARSIQLICSEEPSASDSIRRSHPFELERVNQIQLADHRVQKALGCSGDPENTCLRTTGTLSTPKESIETRGGMTPAAREGTR